MRHRRLLERNFKNPSFFIQQLAVSRIRHTRRDEKAVDVDPEQESEFVDLARAGDRAAFSALVDRYWLPLCRWLTGLTGNTHVAEDLTQEAFVRAWAAIPVLKEGRAFRVWLFRIARNTMLLQQRGPRGIAPAGLDKEAEDRTDGPLSQAMKSEALDALRVAIKRLPEPYRAVYLLWSQEDFPYSEIARVLSITEETARWRVHEARRILVADLNAYLESPSS